MKDDAKYLVEEVKPVLLNAKIVGVDAGEMDLGFDVDAVVRLIIEPEKPVDVEGKLCRTLIYEVWQDPEGNGPGHLALVDAKG